MTRRETVALMMTRESCHQVPPLPPHPLTQHAASSAAAAACSAAPSTTWAAPVSRRRSAAAVAVAVADKEDREDREEGACSADGGERSRNVVHSWIH